MFINIFYSFCRVREVLPEVVNNVPENARPLKKCEIIKKKEAKERKRDEKILKTFLYGRLGFTDVTYNLRKYRFGIG